MNYEQLLDLEQLLRLYRDNLHERGYTKLSESLTADVIESIGDDINAYVVNGKLSRK